MVSRKQYLAAIHIRKTKTGMTEDEYRSLLFGVAGVSSAGEIHDPEVFQRVLAAMPGGEPVRQRQGVPGRLTVRQAWKINELWGGLVSQGKAAEGGLQQFVARQCKVSRLEWLTVQQAAAVIEALKGWLERGGDHA